LPEPWQGTIDASLRLIDELDREITGCERELRRLGADHQYVPLLCTVPGISWVLAYTIAAEIGDISRFPSPGKLAGYTGLCPRVYQSGRKLGGSVVVEQNRMLQESRQDVLGERSAVEARQLLLLKTDRERSVLYEHSVSIQQDRMLVQ
jgi:hypothetical protein